MTDVLHPMGRYFIKSTTRSAECDGELCNARARYTVAEPLAGGEVRLLYACADCVQPIADTLSGAKSFDAICELVPNARARVP